MKGRILLSHGSVLCGSEQLLSQRIEKLRERAPHEIFEMAFLNYTEPDLETAVSRALEQGADSIEIIPWFLIAGKFVKEDLPPLVERVRSAAGVAVEVASPVGVRADLGTAILQSAEAAGDPESFLAEMESRRKFCRRDERCPLYDPDVCGEAVVA